MVVLSTDPEARAKAKLKLGSLSYVTSTDWSRRYATISPEYHCGSVKNAGRQAAVYPCLFENLCKMFHLAGATRCDQRNRAVAAHQGELPDIVTLPHAILIHAIQHDFTGPAFLHPFDPVYGDAAAVFQCCPVTGVLIDPIGAVLGATVDADDDTF